MGQLVLLKNFCGCWRGSGTRLRGLVLLQRCSAREPSCHFFNAVLNFPGIEMFLMSDGTVFQSLTTLIVKKFRLNSKVPFLHSTFNGSALALVTVVPVPTLLSNTQTYAVFWLGSNETWANLNTLETNLFQIKLTKFMHQLLLLLLFESLIQCYFILISGAFKDFYPNMLNYILVFEMPWVLNGKLTHFHISYRTVPTVFLVKRV
jgi:hypothetical protein